MMGLGDFAYWFSWFAYFTSVNFVMTSFTWAILNGIWKIVEKIPHSPKFVVMAATDDLILWLCIFLYGQSLFGLILVI